MAATLVAGVGMNLIDDHTTHTGQHLPAGLGAEQHIERLRRRHQNMWHALAHRGALGLWRVTRAHSGAYRQRWQAERLQLCRDTRERLFQIDVNVIGQRLERRDIEH